MADTRQEPCFSLECGLLTRPVGESFVRIQPVELRLSDEALSRLALAIRIIEANERHKLALAKDAAPGV